MQIKFRFFNENAEWACRFVGALNMEETQLKETCISD